MSTSDVCQHTEGQEARETRTGKGKKGSSRDVISAFDARLAKVELAVADSEDKLEDRLADFQSEQKEFMLEMREKLEVVERLTQRNVALEATVEALRVELEQLRGKVSACEGAIGGGLLAFAPRTRVDVPKPKEFKGSRSAKDVDNFLWGMEQYFRAVGIEDEATKVSTASMYLVDIALLWWRRRCDDPRRGGAAVRTWDEFQREFRQQFYPEYAAEEARSQLRRLTQRADVRDYVREFSELMLQIPNLGEDEGFFSFMDGLRPWARQELKRMGVQTLSRAMTAAESLVDYTKSEPSKPRGKGLRETDEPDEGGQHVSDTSQAKGKSRRWEDRDARGTGTPRTSERKSSWGEDRPRKPLDCFLCGGPHRARDCPAKEKLVAIARGDDLSDEEPGAVQRLGAIESVEEPERVLRLGAIRATAWGRNPSSGDEGEDRIRSVQPDHSSLGVQQQARTSRRTRRRRSRRRASRARMDGRRSPSNEGVARTGGGECHVPRAWPRPDGRVRPEPGASRVCGRLDDPSEAAQCGGRANRPGQGKCAAASTQSRAASAERVSQAEVRADKADGCESGARGGSLVRHCADGAGDPGEPQQHAGGRPDGGSRQEDPAPSALQSSHAPAGAH